MAIETLKDWNERLTQCGCCEMPLCPNPSMEIQQVLRSLCALTANPGDAQMGLPSPNFDPANGGVAIKESWVAYRSMNVIDSFAESGEWGSASSVVNVTIRKDPETVEDNVAPGFVCGILSINGSWSAASTSKNDQGVVVAEFSESGSWNNALTSSYASGAGLGSYQYTNYDDDGKVTDQGTGEAVQFYGPGWGTFTGGQVSTTLGAGGLTHEMTGEGRNLVVQFNDAHTVETAFAAITTPEPASSAWSTSSAPLTIASFAVGRVDEANDDLRLTGAVHSLGRYRWRIPFVHKGGKFKLWWDEGFFSKEWLEWKVKFDAYQSWEDAHEKWENSTEDPKPPEPVEPDEAGEEPTQPTLTEKSVVWAGPGNASNASHASWFTAWSNTVKIPSATEGRVEACNVRFSCYDSPFGSKPQVHHGFRIYTPEEA